MVKLVFSSNGREDFVEINEYRNVIRIGRNQDCEICANDGSVSRLHAMVTWREGHIYVQDPPGKHPTNGTKVDGMPLKEGEMLELLVGSELVCGKFSIRVVSDADTAAPRIGDQQGMMGGANPMSGIQPMVNPYGAQNYGQNYGQRAQNYGAGGQGYGAQNMAQGAQNMAQGGQPMVSGAQPMVSGAQPMVSNAAQAMDPAAQNIGAGAQNPANPSTGPQANPSGAQPYAPSGYNHAYPTRGGYGGRAAMQNPPSQINPALQIQNNPQSPATGAGMAMGPQGDANRYPGRGGFAPQHMQAAPAASGVSSEEAARLNAENEKLKKELEELRASTGSQNDEVQKLKETLAEREQLIRDYEHRIENNDTVVNSLTSNIDNLKEQLEHQKDQGNEARRDRDSAREEAESLRMELENLRATVESNGAEASSIQSANANLKVELQKKIRLLDDLQRELDLAQYSYKEEQDNVLRLKENIDMLNASVENTERENRDMKQVIDQHDMMFAELNGRLADREKENKQLSDALRSKGAGDTAALMQELSEVRDALTHKSSEVELLQKQLDRAQDNAANGEADALRKRVSELEEALRTQTAAAAAVAQGGGQDLSELRNHCQGIDDAANLCSDDFGALKSLISDLQKIFVAYVKIDINHLQGQERTRLENALKVNDPKKIFDEISRSLKSSRANLGTLSEAIQSMRSTLQM